MAAAIIGFIVGFCVGASWLAYAYFKSMQRAKQTEMIVNSLEVELKQIREVELNERKELASLQTQLNRTFEDSVTHLLGWQLFEDRLNQNIK